MNEPTTISFVATVEIKRLLEYWAKNEDRTVSATLRRILESEAQRRAARQPSTQEVQYTPH
jgi:hypothetical protein